jgi:hypothetical protein
VTEDRRELVCLDEAGPRGGLLELWQVRPDEELSRLHEEGEHAPERRDLAVDRAVRDACRLSARLILAHVGRRDVRDPAAGEERFEMADVDTRQGNALALVRLVLAQEVRGGLLEDRASYLRRDRDTLGRVAFA